MRSKTARPSQSRRLHNQEHSYLGARSQGRMPKIAPRRLVENEHSAKHQRLCLCAEKEYNRSNSIQCSALIPYSPLTRFHTATSCGFHSRLCRDLIRRSVTAKRNLLLEYSEELAIKIAKLCNEYKVDSNTVFQIKKSSSSIFANIAEAQYPQSLADMHSKLEIARKECAGTGSWLKLIFASGSIDEQTFKNLRNLFGRIKRILTASCITIENKSGLSHLSITEKTEVL